MADFRSSWIEIDTDKDGKIIKRTRHSATYVNPDKTKLSGKEKRRARKQRIAAMKEADHLKGDNTEFGYSMVELLIAIALVLLIIGIVAVIAVIVTFFFLVAFV